MIRLSRLVALVTCLHAAPAAATGGVEQAAVERLRVEFARMVAACWEVRALPPSARSTVVTLAVEMSPDGVPAPGSIRLVGARGGDAADIRLAHDAARRAILRCAGDGYDLPPALAARWRAVVMTFDANDHLM
jgi:hypothetical protein